MNPTLLIAAVGGLALLILFTKSKAKAAMPPAAQAQPPPVAATPPPAPAPMPVYINTPPPQAPPVNPLFALRESSQPHMLTMVQQKVGEWEAEKWAKEMTECLSTITRPLPKP